MLKPQKLQPGDKIAAVSLSWGGPGEVPYRYIAGKRQFEELFGLSVVEMPNTLRESSWLAANPKARADDLHLAFSDNSFKGVISTIGGDDSIRILPHLNLDLIRKNPKVFLGYSDSTVSHLAMYKAGVVSFYGPSFMAGFAENCGIPKYLEDSLRKTLFTTQLSEVVPNTDGWTVEHLEWTQPENQKRKRILNASLPWKWLQGDGVTEGHLIGGCIEVLDWLRGTSVWPSRENWNGAIIFLETSEDAPSPTAVRQMLRCFGSLGIFESCAGILFGRPGGQVAVDKFSEYDQAILDVINGELNFRQLPIITQMDFGHTDPIMTLPYGVRMRIDCLARKISYLESGVSEVCTA